jgi:hypothetical protein
MRTVLVSKSISKSAKNRVEEDNTMKEQAFLSNPTGRKLNEMGRTCSSRSHSQNTSFLKPHSMLKTSGRIDAELNVS